MATSQEGMEEPMDSTSAPEQKCFLQQVLKDDSAQVNLEERVFKSFLEQNTSQVCWRPAGFELVKNEELAGRYQGRKAELVSDRSPEELEDKYAFLIAKSKKDFWAIINSGLHSAMSLFSVFGPAKSGVYLYQHADLCLKNYALAHPVDKDVQLIVFKYFEGKLKKFVANTGQSETKELTPGTDCHMCSLRPIGTDKPELQFLKSQVYLYELDEYDFPACRPRQCIPYAIVTFTKATLASSSQESTSTASRVNSSSRPNGGNTKQLRGADRFTNYPGLIDIIAGINAKPSVKSTAPPSKSPRGQSQEKNSESSRQRNDSDRSDNSRGRPESLRSLRPGDNPKLREVIEKVNSKKVEKSSLLPIHKNWQQPNQGYQPYRQVHHGQRGGSMNPGQQGHVGQGQMGFNGGRGNHGNMMHGQQGRHVNPLMQQRMENAMMQQRQGNMMQQGGNYGNMGFNQGGNNMQNMSMTQRNQGMQFGAGDMNNFNGMNSMNNPRMQQNMSQSKFSLLNAPLSNNPNRQMNNQGCYGNMGGQSMQRGGWQQ
ncbi:uncharacterized protein LOC135497410 isoform X2 [Lineus longissimus]|uniref:uncharacterized protein LOC135497410 isoform X2 n=1 Tax=Lineus longissimus TaxID=88925 RepID=UPI00315DBD45